MYDYHVFRGCLLRWWVSGGWRKGLEGSAGGEDDSPEVHVLVPGTWEHGLGVSPGKVTLCGKRVVTEMEGSL